MAITADTKKITIEIVGGGAETGEGTAQGQEDSGSNLKDSLSKLLHPISTIENSVLGKTVILNQAYQSVKQTTLNALDMSINRYFSLKEDYLAETTYNNVKTSISKVTGLAASAINGAMMGSSLGPAGSIAGAVIGATAFGVNEFLGYQTRYSNYYKNLNEANFQTGFGQMRAGLVNGSRGTEN